MEQARQLERDLGYVRDVVRRSEGGETPRAIWYLWAVLVVVGFALVDFAQAAVPLFWTIAGPAGFAVSAWLGWRHGQLAGQLSRREGRRHMLHWGALLGAIALFVPLAVTASLDGALLGRTVLLIIALTYFLAGVHLHRPLAWIGLLMAAGYGATFFVDRFIWTGIGALVAVGLVVVAHMRSGDGGDR